MTKTKHSFLIF